MEVLKAWAAHSRIGARDSLVWVMTGGQLGWLIAGGFVLLMLLVAWAIWMMRHCSKWKVRFKVNVWKLLASEIEIDTEK